MQRPTKIINNNQTVTIQRMLPGLGHIQVKRGQTVSPLDVIGRTETPSRYDVINVAQQLGRDEVDMDEVMLVQINDLVEVGEPVAERRGRLRTRTVYAQESGYVTAIGAGWVLLETERQVSQHQAFVSGTVTRVIANRGVMIEAKGTVIEAACGFGGEAYGVLRRLVNSPDEYLEPEQIDAHAQNTIILAGASIDEDILEQAIEQEVRGIIVGGLDAYLLDIAEDLPISVVATEGFGELPMAQSTFNLLSHLNGRELSIRGTTPALLPPNPLGEPHDPPFIFAATGVVEEKRLFERQTAEESVVSAGSKVRITRGDYLGTITTVDELVGLQKLPSGLTVPSVVATAEGQQILVPMNNLELVG